MSLSTADLPEHKADSGWLTPYRWRYPRCPYCKAISPEYVKRGFSCLHHAICPDCGYRWDIDSSG